MQASINQNLETTPVQEVLKSNRRSGKWFWLFLILLAFGAGGGYYYFNYWLPPEIPKPTYQTEALQQGDLATTLLVAGNLLPIRQVDISTEITGTVIEVKVSSGAEVKEGDILARLDPKQQEEAIDKAKAALTSAKASAAQAKTQVLQADSKILQAEAGWKQAQAQLIQAEAQNEQAQAQAAQQGNQIQQEVTNIETAKLATQEAKAHLDRLQKLYTESQGKLPARQELEIARINWQKALNQEKNSRTTLASAQRQTQSNSANVRSTQANTVATQANLDNVQAAIDIAKADKDNALAGLESAEANVASAEAALRTEINNLSKATIKSSLNGIVLKQLIEPGQTVFATSPPPVLFTLVDSLTRMRLRVFIDEAGISQVAKGQDAIFTVDAWPKRSYTAKITDIGLNSELKDNIVTYPIDLLIMNDDLSLKPGMTATATITTQTVKNVLQVPNVALYYTPTTMAAQDEMPASEPTSALPAETATPETTPSTQASAESSLEQAASTTSEIEPEPTPTSSQPDETDQGETAQIWILKDEQPIAVQVKTGITNGKYTEVTELNTQHLVTGAMIILGEEEIQGEENASATSFGL